MSTPTRGLIKAEDVYCSRAVTRGASVPLAEWAFRKHPPVMRGPVDLPHRGGLAPSMTIPAEVNHGRWIVRCPFCPSAQVVSPADPRFLCAGGDGCANAPVLGAFVRVVFPRETTMAGVEKALMARPDASARNWTPGVTLKELREENAAHGINVDDV